nr:FxLYD domain-containing protein [Paenibacillus soyae]
MQRAAEEDLINQTAAVEFVRTEQTLDEFGDLTILGVLKNAATRPIYSVAVEFTVQSASGETIGKGTAQATPSFVEPGEEMTFTATVYGANTDECTVVVDNATWYLD